MIVTLSHNGKNYKADLSKGIDLSVPVAHQAGASAWYAGHPVIAPVINAHFTGSVILGGAVNFFNVQFNPHAHGTHTESVGHIARERYPVHHVLNQALITAQVISVQPETLANGDKVIIADQVIPLLHKPECEALIIRTLPNDESKLQRLYSDTNPPYMETALAEALCTLQVNHLLLDIPSVDRESDGGKLAGHRAFWNLPGTLPTAHTRMHATITELIYVPQSVSDGRYLLNLQVAAFANDAAPSRPVLFALI